MPGTPTSMLGSPLASATLAASFAVVPVIAVARSRGRWWSTPQRTGAVSAGYSVLCLVTWRVAYELTGSPQAFENEPVVLLGWLAAAAFVFGTQVGVPAYVVLRWEFWTAWVLLFVNAFAGLYAIQFTGGESVMLSMWALLFGPLLIIGSVLVLCSEAVVRYVAG